MSGFVEGITTRIKKMARDKLLKVSYHCEVYKSTH